MVYYYPILRCEHHQTTCSPYFQDKFIKNKLFLNKSKGDKLINAPNFWSLVSYEAKNWDEQMNRKFHVDDELLLALHRAVLVESMLYIYL